MKIFWRIFMRQISLTDYFCKGLRFSNGFAVKFCLSDFGFLLCPSKS
ncbi:conserved hypothetical protein [Neisseria meningitidis 053442]|nr:conserved hypothetical protein [Neisseria meningitidis 053442]